MGDPIRPIIVVSTFFSIPSLPANQRPEECRPWAWGLRSSVGPLMALKGEQPSTKAAALVYSCQF